MAEWSKALVLKTNIFLLKYRGFESHFTREKIYLMKFMLTNLAFFYHWQDLKIKLYFLVFSFLSTFFISFFFKLEVFYFLGDVFIQFSKNIIFTKLSAGFWVYFKLGIWSTIFFIIPLILYFTFLYLLKGFNDYQSKLLFLVILGFFIFYFSIIASSLYTLFPFLFSFFLSFENPSGLIPLYLEARFDQYLSFLSGYFLLLIWILLVPTTLLLFNYLFHQFKSLRKLIYCIFFISFLFIAPPDFFLQFFFFILVIILTELLFFLSFIIKKLFVNIIVESRIRTYDEY